MHYDIVFQKNILHIRLKFPLNSSFSNSGPPPFPPQEVTSPYEILPLKLSLYSFPRGSCLFTVLLFQTKNELQI